MDLFSGRGVDPRTDRTTSRPSEVRLLGAFELRIAGNTVPLPQRAQRVIAFLALRGRTGRGELAGTLWPDLPESGARGNLRTALWRINKTGEHWVTPLNGSLDLAPGLEVDVHRFIANAQDSLAGVHQHDGEIRVRLRRVVSLLPDWDDEWLTIDREHLHQLAMHESEENASRLLAAGRYGLALAAALSVVGADPLRESAHRLVVATHLAEGNVVEARRQYDRLTVLLADELGLSPSFALDDDIRERPVRAPAPR